MSEDHTKSQSYAVVPTEDYVTHGGVQMTRAEAAQHGWVDNSSGEQVNHAVVPHQPAGDVMTPDGVPQAVVAQAEQEYTALIEAADVAMIKQVETDLFNGVEEAEEFMYRNAPALMDQGWARAEQWADKLNIDVDMLSTDLVLQEDKAAMLQAIFTGDEQKFRLAIQKTKADLLSELQVREFEIDGERVTPQEAVDLLLAGQLDIEEI